MRDIPLDLLYSFFSFTFLSMYVFFFTGWNSEPGRDSQLEYRLSIKHAKTEDSGLFTCVTPMGQQHAVEIVVSGMQHFQVPTSLRSITFVIFLVLNICNI